MRQFCVATVALLCFVPSLLAQEAGNRSATVKPIGNRSATVKPKREMIIYPVRTGSARDLAEALMNVYENQQISAQDKHNLLLIRVDADSKDELLDTLGQLDRPQSTIVVHVYLLRSHGSPLSADETAGLSGPRDEVLKRIAALQKGDQLSIENRIEITTIENQQAIVQVGQQTSIVSSASISSSRGRVNSYKQVQTGTLFSVSARTMPDRAIAMEINFEKSEVGHPSATGGDDTTPLPATITTLTHQSTIQFADGDAVLAATMVGQPSASSGHSYLVVTANIRDGSAKRPVASTPSQGRTNQATASQSPRTLRSGRIPPSRTQPEARALSAERFVIMARKMFDQADRDGNGILSGEEMSARGVSAFRSEFANIKDVTFDEFKNIMARRFRIILPTETKVEPKPDRSEKKKPALDPRYLAFAKRMHAKYDVDGDGKLSAEERSRMSKDPADADADNDGFVSVEELANSLIKR